MPVERRGWVTRVEIGLVNWPQEEPTGIDRKGGTSRIRREAYVRFCEGLGVKIPGPTRQAEKERHPLPPRHSWTLQILVVEHFFHGSNLSRRARSGHPLSEPRRGIPGGRAQARLRWRGAARGCPTA